MKNQTAKIKGSAMWQDTAEVCKWIKEDPIRERYKVYTSSYRGIRLVRQPK